MKQFTNEELFEKWFKTNIRIVAVVNCLTKKGMITEDEWTQAFQETLAQAKQESADLEKLFRGSGPVDPTKKSS